MEQTIQAIETKYKGYKFRSRTEARWAVFFDAMDYRYEYEPEGYKLANGQWYLPDFRVEISGVKMFAEVKPDLPPEAIWLENLEFLQRQVTDKYTLLLQGPPDFRYYRMLWRLLPGTEYHDMLKPDWVLFAFGLAKDSPRAIKNSSIDIAQMSDMPDPKSWYRDNEFFTPKYRRAVYAAREERF